MSRSNVVALVDHTRIETANDIAGGLSLVDLADLERIEVVKSAGSVLFGSGAFGGAVQMLSKRATFSDRPAWNAEWTDGASGADGGVAHHVAIEGSTARSALRVSGGLRHAGDVETPAGPLANSHYGDWSAGGSFGARTIGNQSLLVTYQRVQAEDTGIPGGAPIAAAARARYTVARRERVGLEYVIPNVSPRVPLVTARASYQTIVRNVEILQSPSVTVTPHAVHATASGQLEARLLPARRHVLVAGAEVWQRSLDSRRERTLLATGRVVGERPVPRATFLSAGAYAQDEWDVIPERARVVLGARYDLGRTNNELTLNPEYVIAAGVRQTPTPGQVVLWPARTSDGASWDAETGVYCAVHRHVSASLLLASAYRSPSLEERFQFLDLGSSVRVGNPDLRPERSVSANGGLRFDGDGTSLRSDVFANHLTDLVADTPGTFEGRPGWVKTNIGRALLYGYELAAERRLAAGLAAHASLAYVRGEDTYRHVHLSQIAPLTRNTPLDRA